MGNGAFGKRMVNLQNRMGITKLCNPLHPAPSTSIQLISTSTQVYSAPPISIQPPPSSLQHLQQDYKPNIARNWAISPNLFILTENWHTWYIGGVDSESRFRFLKFRLQNPFLGKFGPKNSKLSVLSENWYT